MCRLSTDTGSNWIGLTLCACTLFLVSGCRSFDVPALDASRAGGRGLFAETDTTESNDRFPLEDARLPQLGESSSGNNSGDSSETQLPESLVVLASPRAEGADAVELSGWYLAGRMAEETASSDAISDSPATGNGVAYRWRHEKLDQLLASEASDSAKARRLQQAFDDESPFVRATAWIGLSRLYPTRYDDRLQALIEDEDLPLETRRAAGETLARTASVATILAVAEKLGELRGTLVLNDNPLLYSELLAGFAVHGTDACRDRLRAAFAVEHDELRVAALNAWQEQRAALRQTLPSEAFTLLEQGTPTVRAAAMAAAGSTGDPTLADYLFAGLEDSEWLVRMAAIEGLGGLVDSPQAQQALARTFEEGTAAERAAVLRSWSRRRPIDPARLQVAVDDSAWQVRAAAAQAMARHPNSASAALLSEMLHDSSSNVQLQAAVAAAQWPRELAVPLLLEASKSSAYQTREAALGKLQELWPETHRLTALRSSRERLRTLELLEQRWRQSQAGSTQRVRQR